MHSPVPNSTNMLVKKEAQKKKSSHLTKKIWLMVSDVPVDVDSDGDI